MGLRRPAVTIAIDEKMRAKLEWVAGRLGTTSHAFVKRLLVSELDKHADPPAGFGIARERDEE